MNDVVNRALALWDCEGAQHVLVAERENQVFKVTGSGQCLALRLHRKGLRSSAELNSELLWMAALSGADIDVPAPIASRDGQFLHEIVGQQVSMLTWLSGTPLGATTRPLDHPDRIGVFRTLGRVMARMHAVSDAWTPPAGFTRARWDRPALLGPSPLWGRFWENPELTADERRQLTDFRRTADRDLQELEPGLDFGLIHADLVRENVLVEGDRIHLIDFDDSGYGFRLFEVATALIKNMREPDFTTLRDALLEGYLDHRTLDTASLDLFLALRAVTYVGWNILRLEEDSGRQRNRRMIDQATMLTEAYLTSRTTSRPQASGIMR